MKKHVPSFVAGMVTMALIMALGVGAFAASQMTITVNPDVNVKVNGQVFVPKNEQGVQVPMFIYNGTTYAPVRALAEAYGLEVGWDEPSAMATVGEKGSTTTPDTMPEQNEDYQSFKSMWSVREYGRTVHNEILCYVDFIGSLSQNQFIEYWAAFDGSILQTFSEQMAAELQAKNPDYTVAYYFRYNGVELGYVFAYDDGRQLSHFAPNPFNIH